MKGFEMALLRRRRFRESPRRIIIPELEGLQGRPDLVDARIQILPFAMELRALATSLKSPGKARLLAALKYRAPRNRHYLQGFTGLSSRSLAEHIRQLNKVGLIEVNRNSAVSLSCPLPWSMVDIIAYEGKLSNWGRALHQAIGYRSFSTAVRVVMPASAARHAMKRSTAFYSNGIGLIAIEDDGNAQIKIRSKKRRPTSRRFYLMAVGVVLDKLLARGGDLYPYISSEAT